ncbi:GDP-mannose transporter into the lumen of the Golgi [Obelidium mucronatum]|nr:GDP-mannose transporter into the lumen of the Golgi [Obelidium mucronatum]
MAFFVTPIASSWAKNTHLKPPTDGYSSPSRASILASSSPQPELHQSAQAHTTSLNDMTDIVVTESPMIAILAYCLTSNLMVLANKVIMSTFGFKHAFLLLAFQTLITLLVFLVLAYAGFIKHRQFNIEDATKWMPVTMSLVLMIYSGATALRFTSIALLNIFKNMSLILMAYSEWLLFDGFRVTNLILLSFAFMVASAVIAGWDDIVYAPPTTNLAASYFWMFANCVSTAVFSLTMKSKIRGIGFKDFDTVYFNQIIACPVLFISSLIFERRAFSDLYSWYLGSADEGEWNGLVLAIILSGVTQFGIAYCSAWCLRVTSSTTLSMAGTLNKLPLSIIGMILFEDALTTQRVEGVFLAVFGGVLYCRAKMFSEAPAQPKSDDIEKMRLMEMNEKGHISQ